MNRDGMKVDAAGSRNVPAELDRSRSVSFTRYCFWPICSPARGQVGAASLSGIVQDTTGASIPGATVTIQNSASGA